MRETAVNEVQPRTPRDLIETAFRHRKKALFFLVTVVVSTVVALAFAPNTFTSTSKLIVHRGRESVFLDPTTATGETLPLYKEWESEINSELEILSSRELVEEVVQTMGISTFLNTPIDSSGRLGWIRKALNPQRFAFLKNLKRKTESQDSKAQKQIDTIVQGIIKNMEIAARPKSDIIIVTYAGQTPEISQQVVSGLVNTYLERRIALRRIPGAHQFFTHQTDLLLNELKENESRILAVKNEAGIASLDEEQQTLQVTLSATRSEQLQTQALLAAARARVGTIQTMLEQQPSSSRNLKNGSILDPVDYKALQSTLRLEEATLSALTAQDKELSSQIEQLRNELVEIKKLEPDILRLQREQELLENKYRKYSENKEQARINEELETKKFSNVSIVQHATLPEEPTPSGKSIKFVAALFLGLVGAIALAFGANTMDPTLHTAAEVSEKLNRTTLVEIPLMPTKQLDPAYTQPPGKERKGLRILYSGRAARREAQDHFQELCLRLIALKRPEKNRPLVIGLTSSRGGEGVSTLAGKLAATLARDGRFPNILLLDANPVEHSNQLVKQRSDLPFQYEQMRHPAILEEAEEPTVIARRVAERLILARQEPFDMIVLDIPPLDEGGYTFQIATLPDLLALVVDCGRTPWRTVKWATDLLDHTHAGLCGIVLNRQQYTMPEWLHRRL